MFAAVKVEAKAVDTGAETERSELETNRDMVVVTTDTNNLQQLPVKAKSAQTSKADSVYEGLDMNRMSAGCEPVIFLIRRIAVAAVLVYLPSMPYTTASVLCGITFATLAYYSTIQPYSDSKTNCLAIFNELFVAIFTLLTLLGDQMTHGLILIAFIMLIICVNVIVMLGKAFEQLNF